MTSRKPVVVTIAAGGTGGDQVVGGHRGAVVEQDDVLQVDIHRLRCLQHGPAGVIRVLAL
jgi:hypothetical protein